MPDGVLSAPLLIAGGILAAGALAVALRRLDYERIPQAALLAAAFFISSLVSVPVGPSSVHLLLNGFMGLVLGWVAVPAIFVALLLQSLFFGFGGLLVLGVNTLNMALPALVCAALFGGLLRARKPLRPFWIGAAAGATGVLLTGAMVAFALALSGQAFVPAAKVILVTYLPLSIAEAAVTGAAVAFALRVAPELLLVENPHA
ncbi:MAG: cobalt transporter CbiM [Ectothiorhodospiraceae bacterium]|nr:cobalt transporter CbiM [Ectothiorhodospiraceae bacterium]